MGWNTKKLNNMVNFQITSIRLAQVGIYIIILDQLAACDVLLLLALFHENNEIK